MSSPHPVQGGAYVRLEDGTLIAQHDYDAAQKAARPAKKPAQSEKETA